MQTNAAEVERRLRHLQSQLEQLRQATEANTRSVEHRLEALIEHEWNTLKQIHEQPVRELREHAARLTDVCIATARAAEQGFNGAEARLIAFEQEVRRRLDEMSRQLQSAVVELKVPREYQLPSAERIAPSPSLPAAADAISTLADTRVNQPAEEAQMIELQPARERAVSWPSRVAIAVLVLALVAAGVLGWTLQRQMREATARIRDAEVRLEQVAAAAAREAAARQEAAREISSVREMAIRAERIGHVLAAPDLVRYPLAGGTAAARAAGQVLWSHTRGLVFSAARVPPPPPNSAHQLWLLTRTAPVKASTVTPAPDGTVTLFQDGLSVPGPVAGIVVTTESSADVDVPSGDPLLSSVPPAQ